MRCPNCGIDNPSDSRFCMDCGTPLISVRTEPEQTSPMTQMYSAPEKQKSKKRGSKLLLTIAICVIAVLAAAFLGFRLLMRSPLLTVAEGVRNTAKAMQSEAIVKTFSALSKQGAITIRADGSKLGKAIGEGELDATAVLELYMDAKQERCAVSAELYNDEWELLDGRVWAGKDGVGVTSQTLLDGAAYGIDLKNYRSTLPDSIFNPDNGSYYAIPEELYETLMKLEDTSDSAERLTKESKAALRSGARALEKALKENAQISSESTALSFAGKDKKVTAVTIQADGEAAFTILMAMVDWADRDEALRTLVADVDAKLADVLESYLDATLADALDSFLEGIYDEEDWLEEDLEGFEISTVFYVSNAGRQLVGVDCTLDENGEKTKLSARLGPDLSAPDEISFSYKDRWDKFSGEYTVKERSKNAYEASLKVKEDKTTLASGSIRWDKKDGTLKITLGDLLKLKGTLLQKGTTTTFELRSVSYHDDWDAFELSNPGIVLSMEENAAFPEPPAFEDLLRYTDEEEFETLLDTIRESATNGFEAALEELDLF